MGTFHHHIILDLVTDVSNVTAQQLKNFVTKQQLRKLWPEDSLHVLCPDNNDQDITTTTLISLLWQAKDKMDADNKPDFILVTSVLLKKFWEKVCCVLFSPVHNWTVYGVRVKDQPLNHVVNIHESDIDAAVQEVLRSVNIHENLDILRPPSIPENMFNAGFSTRHGGVSTLSPLASLNLVYTPLKVDPLVVIEENRRRLAVAAGFEPNTICAAKVEHGNVVRVYEKKFKGSPAIKYDCLVTNTPGVTLVVPGADCCTILLADTKNGACGAVHSGWMGTVKAAAVETLRAMVREYNTNPADVKVAIGPSVEMKCFSIPSADANPFNDLDPSLTSPANNKEGWVNIDLTRANKMMLEREGVLSENIDTSFSLCTKCNGDLFYSHERTGVPFGSQVGFISCIKK